MVTEILVVSLYVLFCLKASPKTIVCSIFLLLPLHGFVKMAIFADYGSIFTIWKDVGIIIALFKTRNLQSSTSRLLNQSVSVYLMIVILFMLIGVNNHYNFISDIRKYLFPIPLMYLISKLNYNKLDIKRMAVCILLGATLINITGVIDFVSPSLRLAMRVIMGTEFKIASDGTVYYEISSYKMMGIDRICGFMGGGPNMMGVFNASVFLISIFAYSERFFLSKKEKCFFLVAFMLCVFNLILSFSRAGWAIVVITYLYMAVANKKYRKYAIEILFLGLIIGSLFYFSVDAVQKIVDGTLSGNEASSAQRGNMTRDALNYLFDNPYGYGLGATNRENENYVYFAESSLINWGISTGVLGIVIYSFLIYSIFRQIKRNKNNPFIMIASGFIVAYYITAWVSVNMLENPFVYYAWLIMGLGLNKHLTKRI